MESRGGEIGRSLHELPNVLANDKELSFIHMPNGIPDDRSDELFYAAYAHARGPFDGRVHTGELKRSQEKILHAAVGQFQHDGR